MALCANITAARLARNHLSVLSSFARIGICAIGFALSWSCVVYATPFIPESDTQVLEHLPYRATDPQVRELRQLRTELTRTPHDLKLAAHLAQRYIEIGRAESDPRYYGYAQAALGPWWDRPEPPPEVLVLRATLRQNRHEFSAALADLSRVLAIQPRNAQAWLTRAVILQVQGEYSAALHNCLPLLKLGRPMLAVICISSVGSLSGQAAKHYELLRHTLASASSVSPQERLWALTLLAEIAARLNNHKAAEHHFQEALSLGLRDVYLLAAYADFLLDQGKAREAAAFLKNEIRADSLLLRLALAEQQLQPPELAAHMASLQARFTASRWRGDSIHLGEEARFTLHLLKKPRQALPLAQANWAVQREPRDARILLEAALAARDPAAARPVLEMLKKTSLEDAQLSRLAAQFKASQ